MQKSQLTGHLLFKASTVLLTRLKISESFACALKLAAWDSPSWKHGMVQLSWGTREACQDGSGQEPQDVVPETVLAKGTQAHGVCTQDPGRPGSQCYSELGPCFHMSIPG